MNKYRTQTTGGGLSVKAQARLGLAAIIVLVVFFGLLAAKDITVQTPDPKKPGSTVWSKIGTQAWYPGYSLLSKFYPHLGLDLLGGTHLVYEADESNIAAGDKDSALEGARDVIERRVNTLGVAEPVVETTKQAGHSRIIIELAGVQDVNQAIQLIGETPLLEFKESGPAATSTPKTAAEITDIEKRNQEKERTAQDIIKQLRQGASFEALAKKYSDDTANKDKGGDLGWVARGILTPSFEKAIFDDLKVGEITQTPVKTEFGYHVIKKIEERTNDKGQKEVHSAHILLKTESITNDQQQQINWVNTQLSGKHLKNAQVTFSTQTNQPQVSLTFNSEGADLFRQITERNIGKPVGIFLDNSIISSPIVQTAISGGQAVITGNFDLAEAKTLAQRLNAGALPVPVSLISQQTVGATLGSDSLQKSLYAGIVGFGLVALFMIAFYLLPGLLAVAALVLYAVITLGLFEIIPVTLTLAGVAGFILSLGMAVDANVLIFERIKEELKRGDTFTTAIEIGFKRAWPSIRDSNVSSLITCVILYWFGSSIIRGFALTLAIGIAVSMFSAITVTRTLLRLIINRKFVQKSWLFGIRKKHA